MTNLITLQKDHYPNLIKCIYFIFRYLATGESFRSLTFALRISFSYISVLVKETLAILKQYLMPIFLLDLTKVDFKSKSEEFLIKWNFPNCILAIDGKHVKIRCPSNSGSQFYNYKYYFSIVLLVDANYKFEVIDVGYLNKCIIKNFFKCV